MTLRFGLAALVMSAVPAARRDLGREAWLGGLWVGLALLGSFVLLAPRGWPHRWIGFLWCLPMFLITPSRPRSH